MKSYEIALHYDAQSFQAWNGLGNARSIVRDYAGAIEAYEHALMANSRNAVAWCNKAEALIRQGHTRAALDALNEATELDRGYSRAWTLKAEVYETLGNLQEAQKARKRANHGAWSIKHTGFQPADHQQTNCAERDCFITFLKKLKLY